MFENMTIEDAEAIRSTACEAWVQQVSAVSL